MLTVLRTQGYHEEAPGWEGRATSPVDLPEKCYHLRFLWARSPPGVRGQQARSTCDRLGGGSLELESSFPQE